MQNYRDNMRRCRNSHRAKVAKLALELPWILAGRIYSLHYRKSGLQYRRLSLRKDPC